MPSHGPNQGVVELAARCQRCCALSQHASHSYAPMLPGTRTALSLRDSIRSSLYRQTVA